MQIGILEGDAFSERALASLSAWGVVQIFDGTRLDNFLADKEVVFTRLGYRFDETLLSQAPLLRFLCSPTTGHTHLDEEVLRRRGVTLISLRGESAFLERIRATPEHTLGLVIALLRNYRYAFLDKLNPAWERERYRGEEIFGNKIGIVGMGRVGKVLARYFLVMGAEVGYYDPLPSATHPDCRRHADLECLIASSKIVLLSASYVSGQPPLFGMGEIGWLRGKYFVNTARGELVDEDALFAAIRRNELAGVATDVIAGENGGHRIYEWLAVAEERNVIVTPHIGGATFDSMRATEEFIVAKLENVLKGDGK